MPHRTGRLGQTLPPPPRPAPACLRVIQPLDLLFFGHPQPADGPQGEEEAGVEGGAPRKDADEACGRGVEHEHTNKHTNNQSINGSIDLVNRSVRPARPMLPSPGGDGAGSAEGKAPTSSKTGSHPVACSEEPRQARRAGTPRRTPATRVPRDAAGRRTRGPLGWRQGAARGSCCTHQAAARPAACPLPRRTGPSPRGAARTPPARPLGWQTGLHAAFGQHQRGRRGWDTTTAVWLSRQTSGTQTEERRKRDTASAPLVPARQAHAPPAPHLPR